MGLFLCKSSKLKDDDEDDFVNCASGRRRLYGRSPNTDLNLSEYSYVHWKICKDYLKCDIKPWGKGKLKRNGTPYPGDLDMDMDNDRISFDYLPTNFFDQDCPPQERRMRRMRKMYFRWNGCTYKRVVGYREIMMKREYLEYLRDLRTSKEEDCQEIGQGGGEKKKGVAPYDPYSALAAKAKKTHAATPALTKKGVKGSKPIHKKKGAHAKKKKMPEAIKNTKPSCLGKFFTFKWLTCKWFQSSDDKLPTKAELKKKIQKNAEEILKQQAVKKWKWPNKRKRFPVPWSHPPGKYIVLLHRLYRLPKENQERDNEWLYLSSTSEDDDDKTISHFDKGLHSWMTQGISFESQKLSRQLGLWWSLMWITGRNFLHKRNNFYRGHIEYSCTKGHMIPFFITSVLLWTILCTSVISYFDILFERTVYDDNIFLRVERVELQKYWIPYVALVIVNLSLVAIWSLAVILGDGSLIAHYMNCWCAALHEMETSGALDIRKITFRNLQIFILYALVYTAMFILNWPGLVRGSCLLTSMLLFRPINPLLRINQPGKLVTYQFIGLGVQLFILFCARLVMCTLQIFGLMLKNVSEMWNFKFALRFKLLAKESKGQLYQLELNHSLGKLWSHHKLIAVLMEEYGVVFWVGVMGYIVPQVGMFAVLMARMILSQEEKGLREGFYGRNTSIEIYSDEEPTIYIPYYHPAIDEIFMAVIIFLHIAIDFFFTTETLVGATDAFTTGGEFVRRAGIMTCSKSHERRFIFSLQWSFSPTRLRALNCYRFFTLDRQSLLQFFYFIVFIFTIIIRLHKPDSPIKVVFPPKGSCNEKLGQFLVHGICTIKTEQETERPPILPPADYYFFMEHCSEIERKYLNFTSSFEYYMDNSSGVILTANKPPFLICKVNIDDGTPLPRDLENFGRYFQDHGSPLLGEILQIIFSQTHDPNLVDYLNITGALLTSHSDTTGGGYCGPDAGGQEGKLCEWVEYYRDCVIICESKILKQNILLQKMWRKTTNGFVLYTDYSKIDCGVNPFGFLWKGGDNMSIVEPAYDCFGREVKLGEMDLCGNIPLKMPVEPYKPIKGDKGKIYRSYESDWRDVTSKALMVSRPSSPQPPCDNCYDYSPSSDRCGSPSLVMNNCPYSRYWGEQGAQKGYYLAQQCFQWDIDNLDEPKPTGFCSWNYVQGGIIAGHVINQTTYTAARRLHWDKEWDLRRGEIAPCKQLIFQGLRQIVHQLYFQHSCLFPNNPTGSCEAAENFHFEAYRPYEIVNCRLRQIKLDYEVGGGNNQICNLANSTMIIPTVMNPISLRLKGGRSQSYNKFYGCRGNNLVAVDQGYICTTPEIGGACEVDSKQGSLGYWDCIDPDLQGSSSSRTIGQPDDKVYGLCTAAYDNSALEFKDLRRKLVEPELLIMLRDRRGWNSGDPWKTRLVVYARAPNISLPGTVCDGRWKAIFCGRTSVPLHYPFDGRDSVASRDRFECNWEAYWRDCLHPYQSNLMEGGVNQTVNWVYLSKWVSDSTFLQPAMQRRNFPILNVFSGINGFTGCDGRKLPDDIYWRDDCGWVMTPEFTDGDPKGIAVMPPILAIGHKVYSEEGIRSREIVVNCFETEMALYRCTEPSVFPICTGTLSNWEPSRDIIDNNCFRFNTSCYLDFNKEPDGSSLIRPNIYPEGFCRVFCAQEDLKTSEDLLSETFIDNWRTLHTLSFTQPPCLDFTVAPSLFLDPQNPRPIELHLYFEFHCGDKSNNGVIRDFLTNPVSGSFHLPLYKEERTGNFRFIPLEPLWNHLTQKFGKSCDYGGPQNQGSIYPEFVVFNDTLTQLQLNISREDFLGCHGMPLVWLQGIINKYPEDTTSIGVTNVVRDHPKVCFGLLMGGWCEVDVQPFYFLRDDFEITCDGSQGTLPTNCPKECTEMQGHFNGRSSQIEDNEEYYPFVKSKRGYLVAKNYSSVSPNSGGILVASPRTDIPYRRLTSHEFQEAKRKWGLFEDSTRHVEYIKEFQDLIQGPDEFHCYHKDPVKFKQYCIWPLYVQQCYVPCKFIWPGKIITNVSQSLVERQPGQGKVYLVPLAFVMVGGAVEPAFSFVDCAIDPSQYSRQGVMGCNLQDIKDHDFFKWGNFPEFLPDLPNKIVDSSGFNWVPWAIGYPKRAPFTYHLLNDYLNPRVTYSQMSPIPQNQRYSVTQQVYISPYLACHRFTQEDIRVQVITGIETYWNSSVLPRVQMLPAHFSYFPGSNSPVDKTCQETSAHVYLYWEACKFWNVPSKVLRIYGFCKVIFPAGVVHSSYAAISENISYIPPQGCINRNSDVQTFDSTYNSTSGFGLKYSMDDVYSTWNSLCHSCAYTREMHAANLKKTWCGWGRDENPTCLSPMESFNKGRQPVDIGHGIFNHWQADVQNIGLLWKLAVEYSCWSDKLNRWQFYTRWESYHPWSLKLENTNVAAYPIHIAMNALACPYPCRGPDESEDCNSACPHHLHNPCDVKPWEGNFFHGARSAGPNNGLNYTVILKDNGMLCTSQLIGLNEKPQGLGIFGSYGVNFIQCENQTCLGDREGTNVFMGTSEAVLLDDKWIPSRSGTRRNEVVYSEIIDSAIGVRRGPEQGVVTDGGDAPRVMVVHPGYYANYMGEGYSTFCAALEGDQCEIVDIKFNDSNIPGGGAWQSIEEYIFCNESEPVDGYLDTVFGYDCKTGDQRLFRSLVQSDPKRSWDTGQYCCIPYQVDRQQCGGVNMTNQLALDWADKYWATVRETWRKCEDKVDTQTGISIFGWPFTWDKNARYLKGCGFRDCLANNNRCTHKLRNYKGQSDTDFCNRQFDKDENFKKVALQPCNLRFPPF